MAIGQIQIQTFPARLGIDADSGRQQIEQPAADMNLKQKPADMQYRTTFGELSINQDRAWDAYGLGGFLQNNQRIYSKSAELALQGIARRVQEGNRMAQIHIKSDPLKEFAMNWRRTFPEMDYRGMPGYDQVDISYQRSELDITTTLGGVELEATVNRPVYEYEIGKLDIYMQQYPRVEITPPQIDALL